MLSVIVALGTEARDQLPQSFDPADVVWTADAPRILDGALSKGLAFSAAEATGLSDVEVIEPADGDPSSPDALRVLPLGQDLLHRFDTAQPGALFAFGAEERAEWIRDGAGCTLRCRPGSRPAGGVMRFQARLSGAARALEIEGRADGRFGLADSSATVDRAADPQPLAAIPANWSGRLRVDGLDPRGADAFALTIACPDHAAVLRLDGLQFARGERPARPGAAAWLWSPGWWQSPGSQKLAGQWAALGIRRIYVAVPHDLASLRDADVRRFASFIDKWRRQGMQVWGVMGDPRFVEPQGRRQALALLDALSKRKVSLDGMQFDVEPYLLASYAADPGGMQRTWSATIRELSGHAARHGWASSVVVPFWWPAGPGEALDAVADSIRELVVMDYRTDEASILGFAEPFLDWGLRHRVPVRIALEAGPIEPGQRRIWRPASQGALWIRPRPTGSAPGQPTAVLWREARTPPAGSPWRAYARDALVTVDPRATTFRGRVDELPHVASRLDEHLSAWSSFDGLAFHGLEDLQP